MKNLTEAAIKACGGPAALARKLKTKRDTGRGCLTRQAVYAWRRIPLDHVHAIVEMTGGRFTLEQLRPDIFRKAA